MASVLQFVKTLPRVSKLLFYDKLQVCLFRKNCYSSATSVQYLELGNGRAIAYRRLLGASDNENGDEKPGVIFFPGFQSNMNGTKANALENYCIEKGLAYVRFDYQGCGESTGDIRECTISDWRRDALAVLDQLTFGPQVIVGSSLGGLIMLHTYLQRPHRIQGLLGISTSADLPERLFTNYPVQILETIEKEGEVQYTSEQHSYVITKKFIEDAKKHSLLNQTEIPITCQVRLLHGMCDEKVPYQVCFDLANKLTSTNVHVLLRKIADHRFSQPDDITVMFEFLNCMVHGVGQVKDLALKSWQSITIYSHHV